MLPANHEWTSEWKIQYNETDADGWKYGVYFGGPFFDKSFSTCLVRYRLWIRQACPREPQAQTRNSRSLLPSTISDDSEDSTDEAEIQFLRPSLPLESNSNSCPAKKSQPSCPIPAIGPSEVVSISVATPSGNLL